MKVHPPSEPNPAGRQHTFSRTDEKKADELPIAPTKRMFTGAAKAPKRKFKPDTKSPSGEIDKEMEAIFTRSVRRRVA